MGNVYGQYLFAAGTKSRLDTNRALSPDVVLMLADGKEVYMHSALLKARSVYFEDFLGEEEWTKRRWGNDSGLLRVDLKHMKWSVLEYVAKWLCCGTEEGLFGSLSFAKSVDDVIEFLFEIIAASNELLLSPIVLLASEMILKFLHVSNACYILTEASHYHAFPLVASVQGYIACNLETFLESRMLEDLSPVIIRQLSSFIRSKQEEMASCVRGNFFVKRAFETWKDWVENEDIPSIVVPSVVSQKKERDKRTSRVNKFSPSSPPQLSMTTLGKQREVFVTTQGSPLLKSKTSGSPLIKPKASSSPIIKSKGDGDEIFDMDDMDIGPPSIPTERTPVTLGASGQAWKMSSIPRVDMRAVMAEAADSSRPIYVPPRGSPGTSGGAETPFSSLRVRQKQSSQLNLSGLFEGPSTPPSSSRSGGSPWKITAVQVPSQTSPSPAIQSKESPSMGTRVSSASKHDTTPSRVQSGQSALGPVFTPSRQPMPKPSPGLPRRVSSSTGKAWTSAPVHEPAASTAGMSFAAIQQLQLEQGTGNVKDKRSLLEIQQEEQARREEEEFLKWWEAEEEKVRLETEAALRISLKDSQGTFNTGRRGNTKSNGQSRKPRKPNPKGSTPQPVSGAGVEKSTARPKRKKGEGAPPS